MTRFRTATPSDATHLSTLVNSAYRGDYSKKGWTTEADLLDGQRTDAEALMLLMDEPLNQIVLALDGEKIIGCVHVRKELPDTLYFGMLTVEPGLQARGLGKQILEYVENLARKEKLQKVRLTVLPQRKELIAYYERRGFRATGHSEPFPRNDPKFGIPKVEDLELKEYIKVLSASGETHV